MYASPYGLMPYSAIPAYAVSPQAYGMGGLAPQGLIGSALGSLLGGAVGGLFGGPGSSIGNAIGGVAGGLLPFSSGPTLAVAGAEPVVVDSQVAQKPILLPQSSVGPDYSTQHDLIRLAAKGVIDSLVQYLGSNQALEAQFSEVVPLVMRAAELYKGNDFQRAFLQSYVALDTLQKLRHQHPELPAIGST